MKKFVFGTILSSLMAFPGCQVVGIDSIEDNPSAGDKTVTITANIAGSTDTKVSLTPDTDAEGHPIVKVDWKESGETFEVYGSSGTSSTFTQIAGTNQFEGTLPEPTNGEYEAIYGNPNSLDEQNGGLGQSTANDSPVLMSAMFSSSSSSITFEHATAILKPTFKVDGDNINNTITQIVMGNVAKANSGNAGNGYYIDEITITPADLDNIYIHLFVFPQVYIAGHEFTFTVTAGGKNYTGSLTIPTGMSIEAGKLYTADIALTEVPVVNYVWTSGIEASESVEGEGTETSPYLIQSANDLQWMIDQVNNAVQMPCAIDDDESSIPYYSLTHDLEIDSNSGATWTPIGTSSSPFVGYFDGGGYTISGEMVTAEDVADVGFFGYAGLGAVITNLTNAANVTSLAQNLEKSYVGGIVGRAIGFDKQYTQFNSTYIIACHNTGTITTGGTVMSECAATGGIAGGIFSGTCVLACSNTSDLAGNDPDNGIFIGGIVGLGYPDNTDPSIVSCWTGKGVIVGGDWGVIQRANYSTDSNYSEEYFYKSAFNEDLVNGDEGLNYWIYLFNQINYDYTSNTETERQIICNWHWELENGSCVLKEGAPEFGPM
ncbi:MAG: hypothetical protein J5990_00625 [Bacteroidales bacterium]|nr:hypothetical protein [Bacteroidales bacterium]